MKRGDLEIVLTDYSDEDEYNQTLAISKDLYSKDDLTNPKDAIRLMVNFLRTMTFSDNTILCALADEITDLTEDCAIVCERKDKYEVCE